MKLVRISLIAFLLCSMPAHALRMRVCTDIQPHPPWSTPDASGWVDKLVIAAAAEVGIEIEYHAAPLLRCREELRLNLSQAIPAITDQPPLNAILEVPRNGGSADPRRAIVRAQITVYRRTGTMSIRR